ncbi:TPA: ferrous iron transport protein A [bacterium]|jgi:ferrous iron transport protein A|nr:ferrous iron transport protein A [bacterium]
MKPLDELLIGESCKIVRIDASELVKRRLMDLGITKGITVKMLMQAPLKDPIAIRVRGCTLALRRSEAKKIFVE